MTQHVSGGRVILGVGPPGFDDRPDAPVVQLAPPAVVPPIVVGGTSDAALARAAEHGDGWFAMTAGGLAESTARLATLAAERERRVPQVTASRKKSPPTWPPAPRTVPPAWS